jgi:hypothetical protein
MRMARASALPSWRLKWAPTWWLGWTRVQARWPGACELLLRLRLLLLLRLCLLLVLLLLLR